MADKRISELTDLTAPEASDVFPAVQSGTTKKVRLDEILQDRGIVAHNAAAYGEDTDRTTRASAVNSAISAAGSGGRGIVYVPGNFFNYDASAVTFDDSVRMVREGQLTDVYDVKAYGAAGDGTTDDTSAIQATIDAAANEDGVVYFPLASSGYVSGSIELPNSRIMLYGGGASVSVIAASGTTGALFTLPSSSTLDHVRVYNLQFDGNSEGVHGFDMSSASNLGARSGFFFCDFINFDRCIVGTPNDRAFPVWGCTFRDSSVGYWVNGAHPYLRGSQFQDNTDGVVVDGLASHWAVYDCLFADNTNGVRVTSNGDIEDSRIENTRFTRNSGTSLEIVSNSHVLGCDFNPPNTSSNSAVGIQVNGASNSIVGCRFERSVGRFGNGTIRLDGGRQLISSNKVGTQSTFVVLDKAISYIQISHNLFSDIVKPAIDMNSKTLDHSTIHGNQMIAVSNGDTSGFDVWPISSNNGFKFTDNEIVNLAGVSGPGNFLSAPLDDCIVTTNRMRATDGINATSTNANTINTHNLDL